MHYWCTRSVSGMNIVAYTLYIVYISGTRAISIMLPSDTLTQRGKVHPYPSSPVCTLCILFLFQLAALTPFSYSPYTSHTTYGVFLAMKGLLISTSWIILPYTFIACWNFVWYPSERNCLSGRNFASWRLSGNLILEDWWVFQKILFGAQPHQAIRLKVEHRKTAKAFRSGTCCADSQEEFGPIIQVTVHATTITNMKKMSDWCAR